MNDFIDHYLLVNEAHTRAKRFQEESRRRHQGRVLRRQRREGGAGYDAGTSGR